MDSRHRQIAALLPPGARLLFLYDGWCGVCSRYVDWMRARDRAGRIVALPNQTPGLAEITGLDRAQVDRAAWVLDRRGRRYAGAAAVNRALDELDGWRALALLYRVPPLRWIEDRVYQRFATHRGRFARWGAVPGCDRPGAACLPEGTA